MSTRPRFESLDIADTTQLLDPEPARASSLPRHQHALMSGWGGPPQCRAVYLIAAPGTSITHVISYRVPPGVSEVDVAALFVGVGTVLFTTAADATGTRHRAVNETSVDYLETAQWLSTAGTLDSDNGADSGRALIVRSVVAWEWTDVDITVFIDATTAGTDHVHVYALTFTPIHIPR